MKKTAKIFDGKFYVVEKSFGGNIEAVCQTCGEVRKGNELSTGNFISHYKIKHSELLKELKEHTKPDNAKKKQILQQTTLPEMLHIATPDKVYISFEKFDLIDSDLNYNVMIYFT